VLPTTLPAFPFHGGTSDRPSNTSTQGPVAVRQTSLMPRLESLRQAGSYQRNPAVGTAASANTPLSLHSPSCPVPVCNGNEVFARPAFGLDMRFNGVPAHEIQWGASNGRAAVYAKKTTNTSTSPSGRGEVHRSRETKT